MIKARVFDVTRSAVDNHQPDFITRYSATLGRFFSSEFRR